MDILVADVICYQNWNLEQLSYVDNCHMQGVTLITEKLDIGVDIARCEPDYNIILIEWMLINDYSNVMSEKKRRERNPKTCKRGISRQTPHAYRKTRKRHKAVFRLSLSHFLVDFTSKSCNLVIN